MSDQLYCPECADKWSGAYNTDHRCVTCGSPLKAAPVNGGLERARAERDALAEQLAEERRADADLRDILDRAKEERDALAAHVERWHSVYVDLTNSMMLLDGEAIYVADNAMMRRFDEIDESKPYTPPLAPFIAQCQAAGAEEVAERAWERTDWDGLGDTPKEMAANMATLIANELRHQSSEDL